MPSFLATPVWPPVRYFAIVLLVLALTATPARRAEATDVPSGPVAGTWSLTGSPYVVQGAISVPAGQTLTIQPGVQVRFAAGTSLTVLGALSAIGTGAQTIRFTTQAVTPAPGQWGFVRFAPGSVGTLDSVIVEYGGGVFSPAASVVIESTAVSLKNTMVRNGGSEGIFLTAGGIRPTLDSVTVQSQNGAAVHHTLADISPAYSNLTLTGNGINAVLVDGTDVNGHAVWDGRPAALNGAHYQLRGQTTLLGTSVVTVTPGTTVKFELNSQLQVVGRFTAEGTAAAPIRFTSAGTVPAPGDWTYLRFDPSSRGRLGYCTVAYGGSPVAGAPQVFVLGSDFVMHDCTVSSGRGDGILIAGSNLTPTLDTVLFSSNADAAVREAGLDINPTYRNLLFQANGVNGVVQEDGTVQQTGRTPGFAPLGSGANGPVRALLPYGTLNGSGESRLFAGGEFSAAGGGTASYISEWNPAAQQWTPLGVGTNGTVRALARVGGVLAAGEDGVYAGGSFTQAGGQTANGIAQWNAATQGWNSLSSGTNGPVLALSPVGQALFVGGDFTQAGGQPSSNLASWNTASLGWNSVASGPNGSVLALAAQGATVIVGGSFTEAGAMTGTAGVVGYNSLTGAWTRLGGGVNGTVNAVAVNGDLVYVGGSFTQAGGVPANNIAVWDSRTNGWLALGAGTNGPVEALVIQGGGVLVGGAFTQAGTQDVGYLALFEGTEWRSLGSGTNDAVYALAASGSSVYVAGAFTQAGGQASGYLSRYGLPRASVGFPGVLVNRGQ